MDPAFCRVIYIDDRFAADKWLTRDTVARSPSSDNKPPRPSSSDLGELPLDLQANVSAILAVFNQVFVCNSGRSFSAKLAETYDVVKADCSPIFGVFDVDSDIKHDHRHMIGGQKSKRPSSDVPSLQSALQRQMTFSSEADECYGLQLLSRISSDLQVSEGIRLVIPVALVRMVPKGSATTPRNSERRSFPGKDLQLSTNLNDSPLAIDSNMMLQCLDAGALDVVPSPLNKEKVMGLTVHAYRIYKAAKKEQSAFLASASQFITAARRRQQSWVGIEVEKPYAYLREAMVKKLLKGICEPETAIEDCQHGDLSVETEREQAIQAEIAKWAFCAHDFSEDELVYAGYYMLRHALSMAELEPWRMNEDELLRFMQASRVAYNSFVLYHNFRHAVDVMQSLFYFLIQIGTIPPYPLGSTPPPLSQDKSPIALLLHPFEALTLLISAVGHDVGHPGVNNMFLVKLNAPLAQLYNDQSVLEAFHCAAFSQILRRNWPSAFADKTMRKLLISSILATDMGLHYEYMQQLGNLQGKIHESKTSDGWAPKDVDSSRILICGLLIKCADISNVARPWAVAENWTHLLQQEFASQGEMEKQVGMETTLFGGPPELGDVMKLANGQVGFMTMFAYPLFSHMTDVIPAMGFAPAEILTNKGVWITKIEHEKRKEHLRRAESYGDGAISPRSHSPSPRKRDHSMTASSQMAGYFPVSSRRQASSPTSPLQQQSSIDHDPSMDSRSNVTEGDRFSTRRSQPVAWKGSADEERPTESSNKFSHEEVTQSSSGVSPSTKPPSEARRSQIQASRPSNTVPSSLQLNGTAHSHHETRAMITTTTSSSERGEDPEGRKRELQRRDPISATDSLIYSGPVQKPSHRSSSPSSASTPSHFFSQMQSLGRTSGQTPVHSNTDRSSMATSGAQTYSSNLSGQFSPTTTESMSLSNRESRETPGLEHGGDGFYDSWFRPTEQQESDHDQAKSIPGILSNAVMPPARDNNYVEPIAAVGIGGSLSGGDGRTKGPIKPEEREESASTGGVDSSGDGENSTRRRMGRLKFWKKMVGVTNANGSGD